MLYLAEKIVMGIAAVCVLATVAVYGWLGFPSTASIEFIPGVQDEPAPRPAAAPADAGVGTTQEPPSITPEDQETVKKLAEQGVKVPAGQGIVKERKKIPDHLFEYISKEANYLPELKKLKKNILPGNKRLKLTEIPSNSLLKKFGIQQGDVIELIDGEIMEFSDDQVLQYRQLFHDKIKKVREGQPISVTVTRNNRPLQLIFRL